MKASEARLLEFLKKSPQFVIPIYQRTYSWTERECQQLWDDILRSGRNDQISAHFVGSIVYIEKGLYQVSSQTPLLVIDGQQRLTTVTLLLEALSRGLGDAEPIDGFSAKKIRNYYLLNPEEDGERSYKLLLTQTDKNSLKALVRQQPEPDDSSLRVKQNFDFFEKQIENLGGNLSHLCLGVAKLIIVDISLSRDQDNPQLIFESMNSTGRELSQADLIRNYVLMGLEPGHQTELYENHWRPMELAFGQEGYGMHFDSFMRHYLTLKTGEIPNVRAVYDAFKEYSRRPAIAQGGVDSIVSDIHTFANYYCAIALDKETDVEMSNAFQDIRELKVDVAYPFLLELYSDYAAGELARSDLIKAVRMIESYVFRRAICAIPTNSLNKTFANLGRSINKRSYAESLAAQLLLMPSYRRFPGDEEFKRDLKNRDLYKFPRRSYWLRRLENHERKEPVPVDAYTIEHIMPQNTNLSTSWKTDLGPEWQRIQEQWLHTLGNLTLTGYNSEYGDRPFSDKRDMKGGFKESPLRLNQGLALLERWNEDAIRERAEQLAEKAALVWSSPSISASVLDTYRPKIIPSLEYSIVDHQNLSEGSPMRSLFEQLRREILALDPCVTEEFLKLYVAYKAETNFVDIIPKQSRLRLSLNMHFHELHDPKGVARDITNLGRWGNGDVDIVVTKAEEIPYAMGLVRQSLEKQMGDASE